MTDKHHQKSLVFNQALLDDFIHGRLDSAVEAKVVVYLEARPPLLQKISRLSGEAFLKRLREAQSRSRELTQEGRKGSDEIVSVAPKRDSLLSTGPRYPSVPSSLANFSGYQIVKELGRGGMGVVYLANNVTMDRAEVLKVLNERLLHHEGAKERFLREIRAVSKLSHPHIVTSYSVLPLNDLLVFAMEYVPGIDLQKTIKQNNCLAIDLACSFTRQIALALQHASDKGLVHRDIKPSNVIVYQSDGRYQVKILDFGLAKASSEKSNSSLTQDGTMLGTPEYMSPEQTLNAAKADIRADIYSLGCTLYHMLTGRPPFIGTHGEVLVAHAHREPIPANQHRAEIPTELVAIVNKMMAKNVSERFQTPREVASALVPFLSKARSNTAMYEASASMAATRNDASASVKDTSVEVPLPGAWTRSESNQPELSEPEPALVPTLAVQPVPTAAASTPMSPVAVSPVAMSGITGRRARPTRKPHKPWSAWLVAGSLTSTILLFGFTMWQLTTVAFRSPSSTNAVNSQSPNSSSISVAGAPSAGPSAGTVAATNAAANGSMTGSPIPAAPSVPAAASKPVSRTIPTDWQAMFSGADLSGWTGDPNLWFVRDGCITGRLMDNDKLTHNSCLVWQGGEPQDFEMVFDCKVTANGNSGLHFRSQVIDPGLHILSGLQADVDGTALNTGSMYEERGRGSLAGRGEHVEIQPSGLRLTRTFGDLNQLKASIKPTDWNRFRIVARGQTSLVFVNDELMSKLVDQATNGSNRAGCIGLQLDTRGGMEVQFKDLRIRGLPPADVSNALAAGSVWGNEVHKMQFKLLERNGQDFTANYRIGDSIEREIRGKIIQESIQWLASDVKTIAGFGGNNNFGTLIPDPHGDRLFFNWEGTNGQPGATFELRSASSPAATLAVVSPPAPSPTPIPPPPALSAPSAAATSAPNAKPASDEAITPTNALVPIVNHRFTSGNVGFSDTAGPPVRAAHIGDEFQLTMITGGVWWPAQPMIHNLSLNDFVCEVEGRFTKLGKGGWGVGLCTPNPWTGVGITTDDKLFVRSYDEADLLPAIPLNARPARNKSIKLRIERRGDTIRLFIDGKYLRTVSQPNPRTCYLTLYVFGQTGVEARFSSIRVWRFKN